MKESRFTEKEIDWLALEGCEIIGFESGSTVAYDVAGYDRCLREERTPQSLPVREGKAVETRSTPQATFSEEPYPVRVAGFCRRDIFGPDEIGALFRKHRIPWNDGLGNGLYESLRIDRKYGLKHVLEAPILGFDTPFLESEWEVFRGQYPQYVRQLVEDLREVEAVYGDPLARSGERMIVLWTRDYPLALFARAIARNPQGVQEALREAIGRPLPPLSADSKEDRLALSRFWSFVRRQHARLVNYQAGVLREIMGQDLIIVANPHELPPLDMEGQGAAYDYPAVAIRPLLVDDDLFLRHYIAYTTQFYHDLSGKRPMVSVRMNLSAATPQFVPDSALLRRWYDQAVRHGAGAFYFWTRDYPTDSNALTYDGPIPGNPVASTLPRERWDTSLQILGHLATHRQFQQPQPEVAILTPWDSALLHRAEWRCLYGAFSACAEARIHTGFVADRQIEEEGVPPNLRLLLAPALEFVSQALHDALAAFVTAGGALLIPGGPLWDRAANHAPPLPGATTVPDGIFEIFPVGEAGSPQKLETAAAWLRDLAAQQGVETQSWLFDVTCETLPVATVDPLRASQPELTFAPWLYEHGSDWIMPYLGKQEGK